MSGAPYTPGGLAAWRGSAGLPPTAPAQSVPTAGDALGPPVAPLPTPDLELDEFLRDLGLRVAKGVGESKEFQDWYHTLTNSLGNKTHAAWDLLANAHSCKECLADPKLPRRWGTPPSKLATVLGRDPLKLAS